MDLFDRWYRLLDDFRRIDDPTLQLKCSGYFDTIYMREDARLQLLKKLGLEVNGVPQKTGRISQDVWFAAPYPGDFESKLVSEASTTSCDVFRTLATRATLLMEITPSLSSIDEMLGSSSPAMMWCEYVEWASPASFKVNRYAFEWEDATDDDSWDLNVNWEVHPLIKATEYVIYKVISELDPPPFKQPPQGPNDLAADRGPEPSAGRRTTNTPQSDSAGDGGTRPTFGQLNALRKAIRMLREITGQEPTIKDVKTQFRTSGNEANDTDLSRAINALEDLHEYKRPSNRGRKRRSG